MQDAVSYRDLIGLFVEVDDGVAAAGATTGPAGLPCVAALLPRARSVRGMRVAGSATESGNKGAASGAAAEAGAGATPPRGALPATLVLPSPPALPAARRALANSCCQHTIKK